MACSRRWTGPNRNCAETLPLVCVGSVFGIFWVLRVWHFLGAPDVCRLFKHAGADSFSICVIPERRGHLGAKTRVKSQWCCIVFTAPSKSRALRLTFFILRDSHDRKQLHSWGPSWQHSLFRGLWALPLHGETCQRNGAEHSRLAAGIGEMPSINKDRIPAASQHLLCVITGYYGTESGCASLAFGIEI